MTRKREVGNLALGMLICTLLASLPLYGASKKNEAQKLVDGTVQKHPEVTALELSATPAGEKTCVTIAATEAGDLGEKCDEDENAALRTLKPYVEHEPDGYDVTAPLHDANGKLVGTLGIDFKPEAGQTNAEILKLTDRLLKDVEQQIPSKTFLFQPASGK